MKLVASVSLGAVLFVGCLFPQTDSSPAPGGSRSKNFTFGIMNGLGWRVIDEGRKIFYIDGVRAAFLTGWRRALKMPCEEQTEGTYRDHFPSGEGTFTITDEVHAIDAFYEAPENRPIAVVDTLEILGARRRGIPDAVLADRILFYRHMAAQASEQK
jgi:hypothetical protein